MCLLLCLLRSLKLPPTLRERAHMALQAVRGMAFLHSQTPAIIHFDLKPDNLLLEGQVQQICGMRVASSF